MEKQYMKEQDWAHQQDTLSLRRYNVTIGLHLIYGIGLTALIAMMLGSYMTGIYMAHPFLFTIAFFIMSFAGSYFTRYGSYPMALLGYTITVTGFGGMLATILPFYALYSIFGAALMTLLVLLVMTIAAVFMPNAFLSMGRTLFIALIALVIAEAAAMLFGFYNNDLFGLAGTFLFSLYIGYDWAKGQRYPKTAVFAAFTALELYMDIINIFVRLLSLTRNSD